MGYNDSKCRCSLSQPVVRLHSPQTSHQERLDGPSCMQKGMQASQALPRQGLVLSLAAQPGWGTPRPLLATKAPLSSIDHQLRPQRDLPMLGRQQLAGVTSIPPLSGLTGSLTRPKDALDYQPARHKSP